MHLLQESGLLWWLVGQLHAMLLLVGKERTDDDCNNHGHQVVEQGPGGDASSSASAALHSSASRALQWRDCLRYSIL